MPVPRAACCPYRSRIPHNVWIDTSSTSSVPPQIVSRWTNFCNVRFWSFCNVRFYRVVIKYSVCNVRFLPLMFVFYPLMFRNVPTRRNISVLCICVKTQWVSLCRSPLHLMLFLPLFYLFILFYIMFVFLKIGAPYLCITSTLRYI